MKFGASSKNPSVKSYSADPAFQSSYSTVVGEQQLLSEAEQLSVSHMESIMSQDGCGFSSE